MNTKLSAALLTTAVVGALGCATTENVQYEPVTIQTADKAQFEIPAAAGKHLGGDADYAEKALEEFKATGDAPVIRRPGFVLWPFGEEFPVLYCKPLRVCDIELEAGEQVTSVVFGDTVRWVADLKHSRVNSLAVPHLVVKPREYGIATNLAIFTTRRTYHIGLISRTDQAGDYVRNARFYYPREVVAAWNREARNEARSGFLSLFEKKTATIQDVRDLEFGYDIQAGRPRPEWTPVEVFDDGTRTFIQFPKSVGPGGGASAPVLFVKEESGREVRNYRVQDDLYVVDGLFEKALLVRGEKTVTIERDTGGASPRRGGRRRR